MKHVRHNSTQPSRSTFVQEYAAAGTNGFAGAAPLGAILTGLGVRDAQLLALHGTALFEAGLVICDASNEMVTSTRGSE
eukprot:3407922-Prymnesium_polylepis.1